MKDDLNESGATLLEYMLLAALIALVCVTATAVIGDNASNTFSNVASQL